MWLWTQAKRSARVSHNSSGKENRRSKGVHATRVCASPELNFSYLVSGALIDLLCPLPLHPLQTYSFLSPPAPLTSRELHQSAQETTHLITFRLNKPRGVSLIQ